MIAARTAAGAALAGAASGCRSFTGLGVLTLATPAAPLAQPDRTLTGTPAKAVTGALAVLELAADKAPNTPVRSETGGVIGRVIGALSSGAIVARRAELGEPVPDAPVGEAEPDLPPAGAAAAWAPQAVDAATLALGAVTAVAAAAASAWLGIRWRAWAHRRFGRDWPGAVLEDLVAIGLAGGAARLVSQ